MIYYKVWREVDGGVNNDDPQLMDRVHEYYFLNKDGIKLVARSESGYVGNFIGVVDDIPASCKMIDDADKDFKAMVESVFDDPHSWEHIKIEN